MLAAFLRWLRIIGTIVLAVIAVVGIGWGVWQYTETRSYEEVVHRLESSISEGMTVSNCQEMLSPSHPGIVAKYSSRIPDILKQNFSSLQESCRGLGGNFSVTSFFDPENNFRSLMVFDFEAPVGSNNGLIDDETKALKESRVMKFLHIEPAITLDSSNIDIQENRLILSLPLASETTYTINLASPILSGPERVAKQSWSFTTPENSAYRISIKEGVTLFPTNHLPTLRFVSFDPKKVALPIKLCKVDLETYGKIEIFMKNRDIERLSNTPIISGEVSPNNIKKPLLTAQEEFLQTGIDSLLGKDCREVIPANTADEAQQKTFFESSVDLSDTLSALGTKGLYVAVFSRTEDRVTQNGYRQPPLLFGVIDAHIVMKVGYNGEAYFFVTDFAGKPIEGIELSVNANEYSSQTSSYGPNGRVITKGNPLSGTVYSPTAILGKTDNTGILKVDIREKIANAFSKTFENQYEFDDMGKYDSFFITASNSEHLSYVSSKWNGGIAPWNFGYTVNMWYNPTPDLNALNLNQYIGEDVPYYGHVFTDRVLYLPGEEVQIKAILRDSTHLRIPNAKKFIITITDSQGKEVQKHEKVSSDFGSILDAFKLAENIQTGLYAISISDENSAYITSTNFTVEIFKKPKFRTEIQLSTEGLTNETVKVTGTKPSPYWYGGLQQVGNFTLKASLLGKYYSGGILANAEFTYRVFRQSYFDTSYWADCYYGCYWEPNKEFYTEGTGKLDANGAAQLTIPVEFASSYDDYRYILEVTPRDAAGDIVASSNSIIARLPEEYKLWNPGSTFSISADKKFYKAGEEAILRASLNIGSWDKQPRDSYYAIIKKKNFQTTSVPDVRGADRPITKFSEEVVDIIPVNTSTFPRKDGRDIILPYRLPATGEYIVEYGVIDQMRLGDASKEILNQFKGTTAKTLEIDLHLTVDPQTDFWTLSSRCVGTNEECTADALVKKAGCEVYDYAVREKCLKDGKLLAVRQKLTINDILVNRQYITLLTYSDSAVSVPEKSDNKIVVLSEKVSYKIGEKARVLVRLPFSKGKILWTIEKKGVEKTEYIDVAGNIFFKEFTVDEDFAPNTYIGVVAFDTTTPEVPEYKVGYTEVVIDKTDKKSLVTVKTDKQEYKPRDTVKMDIDVARVDGKKSVHEVSVAVVDDSLVSMMGNIDTNTLEKIWQKLPFQIQTSITNIAMLRNYYFSRPGIVGGSGSEDNKGGDGAKSTRTIFKNTAYYKGDIITDENGHATVSFTLPDNLTQFRVIAVANAKDNVFGSGETLFNVRKALMVEDKTPFILRKGDTLEMGANVFNNSGIDLDLEVSLSIDGSTTKMPTKIILLKNNANQFVTFPYDAKVIDKPLSYTISASDAKKEYVDSVKGTIGVGDSPVLIQRVINSTPLIKQGNGDYTLKVPTNTDNAKSSYELSISNNPLGHLEQIIASLLIYPYGCIEQSVSSTMPNILALKFAPYFSGSAVDQKTAKDFSEKGIKRILGMQTEDGGFGYWEGDPQSNLHITPYVTRSLMSMRDYGAIIDEKSIQRAIDYLDHTLADTTETVDKIEIFATLARANKGEKVYEQFLKTLPQTSLVLHEKVSLLDGLVHTDKTKYQKEIHDLIVLIQKDLRESTKGYDYWYWNIDSDMANFASILMEVDYEPTVIESYILELSERDYDTFFGSTQAKNAVFGTFLKYIEKYGSKKTSKVTIELNGKKETINLTALKAYKKSLPLNSVVNKEGKVPLTLTNASDSIIYVNSRIIAYPLDVTKIQPYSNGIQVSRTIDTVINTELMTQCTLYYYNDDAKKCESAFAPTDGIHFNRGQTYRITLKATFTDEKNRHNLTLEDYLPSSFRVLNSNFKTNTIATSQATDQGKWYFDHVETTPNVIMAYASSVWGKEITYTYFVIPEFSGNFLYPPEVAYLMYNPDVRAFGGFRNIVVK